MAERMEHMRILVVEDNERQQQLAKDQLCDLEVVVTSSYSEAFHMMDREKFDALLTDMNLPAETGYPLGDRFVGQEVQAGWALVLKGISVGILGIGLLTNADHHNDAASSLIDLFESFNWNGQAIRIGNSKVFLDNHFCINYSSKDGMERGDKFWNELLTKVS
jgi:CheY-like chemotaxis protein